MSDLQCPATVVFVPDAARAASLPGSRFRVADVREFSAADDAAQLDSFVSEVSDEFRGECVAVVAPAEVVRAALGRRGIPIPAADSGAGSEAADSSGGTEGGEPATSYVAVAVDSGGWTLLA